MGILSEGGSVPEIEELQTFVFCCCPEDVNLGRVSHFFEESLR